MSSNGVDLTLDDEEIKIFNVYFKKHGYNSAGKKIVRSQLGNIVKATINVFSKRNQDPSNFSNIFIAKIPDDSKSIEQKLGTLEQFDLERNECGILLFKQNLLPSTTRYLSYELKEKWIAFSYDNLFVSIRDLEDTFFIDILSFIHDRFNRNPIITWNGSRNQFYIRLLSEINTVYYYGNYSATYILIRKLIENLLVEILREHYKPDVGKYFFYYRDMPDSGQFRSFRILNRLFWEIYPSDLISFSTRNHQSIYGEIEAYIDEIRISANAAAHSIEMKQQKKNIELDKINEIVDFLSNIWQKMIS